MRSSLYVPANSPSKILNAPVYGSDSIIFDLEDAVLPEKKKEARYLLQEMLALEQFSGVHCTVRINDVRSPFWKEDLRMLTPLLSTARAGSLRVAKVESQHDIILVDRVLSAIEGEHGLPSGIITLQALLETPLAIEEAYRISGASERIEALVFGAEDYCSATGIDRYGLITALDYPKSRIVAAAAAYGRAAYDTAYGAFRNSEGLEQEAIHARALGFTGKSVIHPSQIEVVNRIFSITERELEWAKQVLGSSLCADQRDGVTEIEGMMIDMPVISRAQRILARAENQMR
ncbi:MAG: CoA ester lyase [Sphaerochaetaceae bacterium]|nr:CoA ester lyase [Sphaerochaetaceae bacterium]